MIASVATVLFSLWSKIFLKKINITQGIFIGIVLLMFFLGWKLVRQDWRFGIFLFASLCFLVSGLIILRSGHVIGKILFIAAFIISAVNIVPILFFISEKSLITQELISTLFISNKAEAQEYLIAKLNYQHILVIVVFIIVSVFIFLFNKKNVPSKAPLSLWMLFFISLFTATISGPVGALASEYVSYVYQTNQLTQLARERSQTLEEYKLTIQPDSNAAKKIVVVIGESLNRNYMALYGYERATTPNLSALSQDSTSGYQLFAFKNIISPEATTVPALKKVLTNISNKHPIPFEESISLIDYFNKTGYTTYWISNQAQLGKFSTPTSVISSAATHVYFSSFESPTENSSAPLGTKFDEVLLNPFEKFISKDTSSKEAFFIHLMGSHTNYEDRYPEKFNVYKKKEENSRNLYLNSILYNDWVVYKIMEIAKKYGADAIFYLSDHSEELGNGHNPVNFDPVMVEIPFVIYASKKYLDKNNHLLDRLKMNINTPAMTDNFFHFIQDFTGVKSSLYDSTASFISPYYINEKRVVNNDSYHYDK